MVLGMKAKSRRGPTVHVNYLIHIQEIKPWPPSQSLRSLRSMMIQWENGERSSGSTNLVVPSLGSVIGEGKIEFDESFRLPVTLLRDMSIRGGEVDVFQKNSLEFNLYETRRDKTAKGQLLGTAIIDLAEYGILKETLSISAPLNCKRNYRNMDQPTLFIKMQPVEKGRANSLSRDCLSQESTKENNGCDSVSASMNEEYAEEAEVASFSDDDVSSHSSAAVASGVESNGCAATELEENVPDGLTHNAGKNDNENPLASETRIDESNRMPQDTLDKLGRNSSNMPSDIVTLSFGLSSMSSSPNHSAVSAKKHLASPSCHSSPLSLVCDHLEEDLKTSTRSCGHENLDQEVHGKAANIRNTVTDVQTNSNECTSVSFSSGDKFSGEYGNADKYCVKEGESNTFDYSSVSENGNENSSLDEQNHKNDEQPVAQGAKDHVLLSSSTYSLGGGNIGLKGNILKSERLKHVKSVRSSPDTNRSAGALGSNHLAEVKEIGTFGDAQNGGGNSGISDKKEAEIYPKEERSTILDSKIQHLENKIRMLEGELREAAAIEAALYSVVAEHGSSMSKVHAPARRLSRLYHHACKEDDLSRRAGAARSSVSGLVLVAKACGNDVPRLTFWLSNSILLRTIICQTTSVLKRKLEREGNGKITPSLRWKGSSAGKNEDTYAGFGNWGDPQVFTSALEKIEAWIFSRIVESIWWQTLTPHMQPVDAKVIYKGVGSASRKSYKRIPGSCYQEQGDFSLDIWKNAFREACERLCPIRAGGHECGCLPVLSRLIMEQCVARLDVAMFNAILRESADEIPTDPVSDPISDARVLPIPPGKSSFGAGALLKTAIGNWSRWLTDLFGMDEDDSLKDQDEPKNDDERHNESFKCFHLLNALSDLLMLPKDMLLSQSIRKEVCPMFSAPLIKKILDNFVADEFCPDPIPIAVLEALESEDDIEDGNESVKNFPCIAAPVVYLPPSATSIASITGDFGSESQLRRSRSSVVRKAYTSDDELDELSSPLSAIFLDGSMSPAVSRKPGLKSKENHDESAFRYELLRDLWMNSE